jgi:hypothetical protein
MSRKSKIPRRSTEAKGKKPALPGKTQSGPTRTERGRALLDHVWQEVEQADLAKEPDFPLASQVKAILDGPEKSWRYAMINQVLAKATEHSLDARTLQSKDTNPGSWDAREFVKRTVVPWEESLGSPLGGSKDPYVSNIFRELRFGEEMARDRRNAGLYASTLAIVDAAQATTTAHDAKQLLRGILVEVRKWLRERTPEYAIPLRVSLESLQMAIGVFLSERSGGERLQATAYGVFRALKKRGLYHAVTSAHVNTSDTAAGRSGDVECLNAEGGVVLTVEAKDRPLTPQLLDETIAKARLAHVSECLILVHGEQIANVEHREELLKRVEKEFSSGLNVYIAKVDIFFRTCFMALGETGRLCVLQQIGEALAEIKADHRHRLAWRDVVKNL